jgi:hypothetical protein
LDLKYYVGHHPAFISEVIDLLHRSAKERVENTCARRLKGAEVEDGSYVSFAPEHYELRTMLYYGYTSIGK